MTELQGRGKKASCKCRGSALYSNHTQRLRALQVRVRSKYAYLLRATMERFRANSKMPKKRQEEKPRPEGDWLSSNEMSQKIQGYGELEDVLTWGGRERQREWRDISICTSGHLRIDKAQVASACI